MSLNVVKLADKDDMDRNKALDAALSQIERAFGKGSVMRLGQREIAVEAEAVSTGSLGLDIALGIGGLPRGRVIEIYGPESSGKTTLALHVIAEAQRTAAWAEVARRLAHEIRNPLTPIQLSAERLKVKLAGKLAEFQASPSLLRDATPEQPPTT